MKSYILIGLALFSAHLSFAQNGRGKAELFIQLEDRGAFTVYLDQEFIGSTSGKFRFYDVLQTSPTLSILQGNKKIYSGRIDLRAGQRLILGFSLSRGLSTLKTLNIYRNSQYALDNFDDEIGAYNTGIVPPGSPEVNQFQSLVARVKKEAFDDDKTKVILAYTSNANLSTTQISILLKMMVSDDRKLSVARSLLPIVTDPQNYYTLVDVFTFPNEKDNFLSALASSTLSQNTRGMRNSTFEQLKTAVKNQPFDDDKTKLIQAALQNSTINTAQLTTVLKMYAFEGKALDCAKLVYNYVADKQSYFTLREIFRFRDNQDALLDFLGRN